VQIANSLPACPPLVAMCNCLIREDSCKPAFRILEWKQFLHIFCYTVVCELFQTKHETCRSSVDIYDNSTDRKTAIRCTKT